MANKPCPLGSKNLRNLVPMDLDQLHEIERHISAKQCPHSLLNELVFEGMLEGTTPLIMACQNGRFEAVRHIVENWGVSVGAAATYYFYPFDKHRQGPMYTIHTATPLFVAASNGRVKIVRYLIEKLADVFVKTSNEANRDFDGLTPLYGALCEFSFHRLPLLKKCDERNAIIHHLMDFGADPSAILSTNSFPVWRQSLGRASTITELINRGMDLQLQDKWGGTVLHFWAGVPQHSTEEEALVVVNILLSKGANSRIPDIHGFTPLLKAAFSRDGTRANLAILDAILGGSETSFADKIHAMELAGAVMLSHFRTENDFPSQEAFRYCRT